MEEGEEELEEGYVKGDEEEQEDGDEADGGGSRGKPIEVYEDTGKPLRTQVRDLLAGRVVHMSNPVLTPVSGVAVEFVRVDCQHHVGENGEPCMYQYRFELYPDGELHQYGRGVHMPHLSTAGRRLLQRDSADHMAKQPGSVSSQVRRFVAKGGKASAVPHAQQVYRRRSDGRREARADGGSSPSELAATLHALRHSDTSAVDTLFIGASHSDLVNNFFVVQSDALLQAGFCLRTRDRPAALPL